jgi:SanA protein
MNKMKGFTRKRILIFVGLCLLILLSLHFYVKYKARHKIFSNVENVTDKDFAIVLGAAIKNNNQPGNYLKYRLDDAITLYQSGRVKKILISGDNGEDAHDEISVMNNYLVKNGVPQDIIFGDYAGFDTYSTMERAEKIFGIENAIIVSQGFHLPRAVYIAREKGIDAIGYSTRQSFGKRRYFLREYFATIKSFFDCAINRKSKYYGKKENTDGKSNIKIEQLK